MIKENYIKYIKSRTTVATVFLLTVISSISFVISYFDKQNWIYRSEHPIDPRVNMEVLKRAVEEYSGFEFMFDYWYVSDFYPISFVILLLFVGVILSNQILKDKNNCYGNLIVSRCGCRKYFNNIIISQSLYIFTLITLSMIVSFVLAFIIGGFSYTNTFGMFSFNLLQMIIIIVSQTVYISFLFILINGCSLMSVLFIKNKYVLQALPLLAFFIIPVLLVSVFGGISSEFKNIISPFIIFDEITAIDQIINDYGVQGSFPFGTLFYHLIPLITYSALFIGLYFLNLKKSEKNYI